MRIKSYLIKNSIKCQTFYFILMLIEKIIEETYFFFFTNNSYFFNSVFYTFYLYLFNFSRNKKNKIDIIVCLKLMVLSFWDMHIYIYFCMTSKIETFFLYNKIFDRFGQFVVKKNKLRVIFLGLGSDHCRITLLSLSDHFRSRASLRRE